MSVISGMWVVSIETDDPTQLVDDSMFVILTQTMSIIIERLLTLNYLLLPKEGDCGNGGDGGDGANGMNGMNKKRAWLSMELLLSQLVPFRVWRVLLEVLSRASEIMKKKHNIMSDDSIAKMSLIVRSISTLLTYTFVMCPPSRFTLMELLSTMDIEEHWNIPKSILQHVLSDVPRKISMHESLYELRKENLITEKEKVFDFSWSQMNSSVGSFQEKSNDVGGGSGSGGGGITQLFVVTSRFNCLLILAQLLLYCTHLTFFYLLYE